MTDQHFIRLFYGNEDKSEESELHNFESPKEAADFLREVADNIEEYKNSKAYRASEDSIFKNTIVED